MVFGYVETISGVKKNQSLKKGPKIRWPPIATKNHAQYFIKWYEILKSALSLLSKQF